MENSRPCFTEWEKDSLILSWKEQWRPLSPFSTHLRFPSIPPEALEESIKDGAMDVNLPRKGDGLTGNAIFRKPVIFGLSL